MDDPKFTIEEIEAAIIKAPSSIMYEPPKAGDPITVTFDNWGKAVVKELTNPQCKLPEIKVGEVCFFSAGSNEHFIDYVHSVDDKRVWPRFHASVIRQNCRSLNETEVPGWARAKEALELALEYIRHTAPDYKFKESFIAKIKELTNV